MKTLIILFSFLLLSVSCSQNSEPETLTVYTDYSDLITLPFPERDTLYTQEQFITSIFIGLVNLYEEECYNDSSLVPHHIGGEGSCWFISSGFDMNPRCTNPAHSDTTIWVHREPTFKGFIEFVKRNYQ